MAAKAVYLASIARERDSIEIRKRIAFVSEVKEFYPYMTVDGMIRFTAGFYPSWRRDLEEKYLRLFELRRNENVTKLSKGMRSKLGLLLAFCRGVELIILDEPTDGLDPVAIDEALQAVVSSAADGTTVFFSSHQLAEVEQIADRVGIIAQGRIRLEDSLEDLKRNYRRLQLVFEDKIPVLAGEQIASSEQDGRTVSLLVSHGAETVIEQARSMNGRVLDVSPVTLKEIFLDAVRGEHQ
jgi:ABC-2 type transport system ATP-binding protein